MFDVSPDASLRRPRRGSSDAPRTPISFPGPLVELELLVTPDPDALSRIVRIVSTGPFTLMTLHVGVPVVEGRRMRLVVAGDEGSFETLRKRLDRVIDVLKVKILS